MKEELLHYVWKTKSFIFTDLLTTEDQHLEIQNYGFYNLNSGPDFLEGKVLIDGTIWAGHIEMHTFSSDWIKHNHQIDEAYNNVVLHVVWEEDEIIYLPDGTRIPCLELKDLIPSFLIEGYQRFIKRDSVIACSSELRTGDNELFYFQLNKMFIERLEDKSLPISKELEDNNQDWSQLLFLLIAKSLGLKVNNEVMESLAKIVPHKLLMKHRDNLLQIEALLFGQAGLLEHDWSDAYAKDLCQEYHFLSEKYQLKPISGLQWKLMRMRPNSFPTIRIAQLAMLYYQIPDLHDRILEIENIQEIVDLLDVKASEYWDNHYLIDKAAEPSDKYIGLSTKHIVIINAIVPFLFAFGQYRGNDVYIDRAIRFMNQLPPEINKLTKEWVNLGIVADSAYQSQALIQLIKNYCSKGRCLECSYGNHVLRNISQAVFEESMQKLLA